MKHNERMKICKACPELTRFRFCSRCGCFAPAKVRQADATCPLRKW
jgi:membrane protease subunit (stomatin/prohibitin family)